MKDKIKILYEDNHLIAVNKEAGLLVHEDITGDATLADKVKDYIKSKYDKPGDVFLGVIHRIDRPVSGIIWFARTSKALTRMNEMLKIKSFHKTYLAIVEGIPYEKTGTLENWLLKDHIKNKTTIFNKPVDNKDAKFSQLHYQVISSKDGLSLLKLTPTTGRSHQIRVQLSNIGCSICNDLKYGAKVADDPHSIYLHSLSTQFEHPVKKTLMFNEASIPTNPIWLQFLKEINSISSLGVNLLI